MKACDVCDGVVRARWTVSVPVLGDKIPEIIEDKDLCKIHYEDFIDMCNDFFRKEEDE